MAAEPVIRIPVRLAAILFDTAVGSMDFGSGFLDDEEVAALREAAVLLGADPDEATPRNFRCKYRGRHAVQVILGFSMFISFADGLWRNAYRNPADYPADARPFLRSPDGGRPAPGRQLAKLAGKEIRMYCGDCGRTWDAFGDTSIREPA